MSPTISMLLARSAASLEKSGVDSPRLSAEVLLAHVLGCSRLELVIRPDREVPEELAAAYDAAIKRRQAGEPVAYLTGIKEFYGLDFAVAPGVLIPRPETEHLIEIAEEKFNKKDKLLFADWGTGSGCIAVTLAMRFPDSRGIAVDLSPQAIVLARANADGHGVGGRLSFLLGDFTTELMEPASLDLLVSNPPYVTDAEFRECDPEVALFEPEGALRGGVDGLDLIRPLVVRAGKALRPGGTLLMEIGYRQGDDLMRELGRYPEVFGAAMLHQDLAGRDRIVSAIRL